ncbi:MAG TPA: cytochrome c3 family protein [Acidobacteriota bacterium]|nr:cytochrome c3 family protein [Acidobacteriota bacterium]
MNRGDRNKRHASGWMVVLTAFLVWTFQVWAGVPEPDDETCLTCHATYGESLRPGPHRLSSQSTEARVQVACVNCHEGGEVHAEDPSVENISNPIRQIGLEVEKVCTECHQAHGQAGVFGLDPHAGPDLSCTACHSVHGGLAGLLVDEEARFCKDCHVSVGNQFQRRSNHPLTDGNISCLDCHDFVGRNEPDYGHGGNVNCYRCHPEQSGPYLWEHEAGSSFTTEGGGCVACHSPHGSSNERLLDQPGSALCRQCHLVGPLHAQTAHGGQYAGFSCVDCHSEVHGSNEPKNAYLLDPFLGLKLGGSQTSCFCHHVSK